MPMETDLKEFEEDLDNVRNRVHSFKKTRLIIKIIGIIGMIAALFLHYWLIALLLWILFFPDLNEFIKFFKKRKHKV